jgi:hypothetical protein
MTQFYGQRTEEGEVLVDWPAVKSAAGQHQRSIITVEEYNRAKIISNQMIRWWKGVLLPALEADTGDHVSIWETRLKLNVDVDYFKPFPVTVQGMAVTIVPSVAGMPMKRAIKLVDGSVAYLHEQGFMWATLPDPTLRKGYFDADTNNT